MAKKQTDVLPGTWVRHEANVGLVQPYVVGQHKQFVPVKWLPAEESAGTSFAQSEAVLADVVSLEPISEPQLGRVEAAAYAGMTPTNLYRAKRDGWFGGPARQPFYALPSEIDKYLAAPKARSGVQAAALAAVHRDAGRIITEAKQREYKRRLSGGSSSRRRKGGRKASATK